jgi:hypothetical protein
VRWTKILNNLLGSASMFFANELGDVIGALIAAVALAILQRLDRE